MGKEARCIKITPADFIHSSYIKCPKCGKDTFGVLYLGKTKKLDLNIDSIVHDRINSWQGRYIITANFQDSPLLIEELRANRDKAADAVLPIFKRWQTEKGKDFSYWYNEEKKAAAKVLIEEYFRYIEKLALVSYGKITFQAEEMLPPPVMITMRTIKDRLKESGINDKDLDIETAKFLRSDLFEETPSYKISAMLYAAMARKAAYGRKEPPSKGFMNDVKIISSLLPYCDAMFIDNECRGFLLENPLKRELNYGTEIFSCNNRDEFLEYLDSIYSSATEAHLGKVREVYGEDWAKPFNELYKNGGLK